jgi:hypothetical protein
MQAFRRVLAQGLLRPGHELQVISLDPTALAGVAGKQHSFTTFRLLEISSPPSDELG